VKKNIVGITDDLFYDSARSRVYVLNALGSIDVFQQKDPDHYDLIASIPTPLDSKTGLFVPDLGSFSLVWFNRARRTPKSASSRQTEARVVPSRCASIELDV